MKRNTLDCNICFLTSEWGQEISVQQISLFFVISIRLTLLPCTCFVLWFWLMGFFSLVVRVCLPSAFCFYTSLCQTQSHKLAVCKRLQSWKRKPSKLWLCPLQVLIASELKSKCLVNVFYTPSSSAALPIFTKEQFIKRTPSIKKPSVSFDCQYKKTENTSEGALSKCPLLFQL